MDWELKLKDYIRKYCPQINLPSITKYIIFYREILKWNRVTNLISRKSPETTLVRLMVDSLFLLSILRGDETFLDVGAGAGFPGIPVLLGSRTRGVLVEARKKRAAFLNHMIHTLEIANTTVLEKKLTPETPLEQSDFDCLWSKAGIPRHQLFALGERKLHPGGRLVIFHPMDTTPEEEQMRTLARNHGFKNIRFRMFQCPDLLLTRTLITCEK
jgi:16S rRNA (guanine527-N7)-methyltransferase